ncbi:MAG: type II 3-dehydroquinate dehydratase [Chitinophagaceae bacterium]
MKIGIINGPNLNLVGTREPSIYGHMAMDDFITMLRDKYANMEVSYFQSNHEGELIDYIQDLDKQLDALIINAGAFSHTSIAILDALKAVDIPKIIEVHLSNIYAREAFRHHSYISTIAHACIVGFGLKGYEMAIDSLLT